MRAYDIDLLLRRLSEMSALQERTHLAYVG
jgi:hypothetical protein